MSDQKQTDYALYKIGVINTSKNINYQGYMIKHPENSKLLGYVCDGNGDPFKEGDHLLYGIEMGVSHSGILFYITSGEFSNARPIGYGIYLENRDLPGKMVQWTLQDGKHETFEGEREVSYGVVFEMIRIDDREKVKSILMMDIMKTADDIITDMELAWKKDDYAPILKAV